MIDKLTERKKFRFSQTTNDFFITFQFLLHGKNSFQNFPELEYQRKFFFSVIRKVFVHEKTVEEMQSEVY